jgi:hypothetical protein
VICTLPAHELTYENSRVYYAAIVQVIILDTTGGRVNFTIETPVSAKRTCLLGNVLAKHSEDGS